MAEKKIDMSLEAIIKLDKKKNKGTASTTINKTFRRGSVKLVRGRNRGSQVPKKKQQNDARGGRSRRNWTVSVKTQKQSGNRPRPRPGKPNMQQQQKNVNIGISRINSRKSLKSRNGSQGRLKTLRSDYLVENVSKNTQKRANPQRLLNSSVKGILSKKNRNRKTETNLFTKNFDARKKITSKKEQKQGVQGIRAMTKKALEDIRKDRRSETVSGKRDSTLFGNSLKVVAKQKDSEERHTTFTGKSIKVLAHPGREERQQRQSVLLGDNSLAITTTEKTSDDIAYKSDYQAFEERRKLLGGRSIREGVSGGLVLSTSTAASKPTMPYTPTRNEMFGQEEYQTKKPSSSKVIITNLHPNVSQEDIKELFGVVGPLRSARLIRTGMAEVVYMDPDDSFLAYKKYHSRNLDGQPMLCKVSCTESISPDPRCRTSSDTVSLSTGTGKSSSRPVVFTVKI